MELWLSSAVSKVKCEGFVEERLDVLDIALFQCLLHNSVSWNDAS